MKNLCERNKSECAHGRVLGAKGGEEVADTPYPLSGLAAEGCL